MCGSKRFFQILCVILVFWQSQTKDINNTSSGKILSRRKRFIIFPEGSSFQLGKKFIYSYSFRAINSFREESRRQEFFIQIINSHYDINGRFESTAGALEQRAGLRSDPSPRWGKRPMLSSGILSTGRSALFRRQYKTNKQSLVKSHWCIL